MSARFAFASEIALAFTLCGCSALLGLDEYYITDGGDRDGGADAGGRDGGMEDGGPFDAGPFDAGVNQPPVLRTVALSTYRPIVGETIVAMPGRIEDPEDDRTSVHYQWFADGAALDGRTSSSLAVTAAIGAGARIDLEAWARDTVDGPRITVGPVDVIAEQTRWRALEPTLEAGPPFIYDARHHRLVYLSPDDQSVWEYALDAGREHWAKLFPTGTMPPLGCYADAAYDPVAQRMLLYGGAVDCTSGSPPRPGDEIVELDLRNRGGEVWGAFTPGGDALPPRVYASVVFLPADQRMYLYGGSNGVDTLFDDVWALTLERGAERWDCLPLTAAASMGSRLVAHPTEPVLYAIGGAGVFTGVIRSVDTIQRIDVAPGAEATAEIAARLPVATTAPAGVVDPAHNRAVIAFGVEYPALALVDRVAAFDFTTENITELTPSGSGPPSAAARVFDVSDADGSTAYLVGGTVFGRSLDVYAYDLADDAWQPIAVVGIDRPPARAALSAIGVERKGRRELRMWGGSGDPSDTELWIYDGAWRSLEPLPDTRTGNRPAPRTGIRNADNAFGNGHIAFAGGGESIAVGMTAWELLDDQWLERTLSMPAPLPPFRNRAAYFDLSCGIRALGLFGGGTDDTWFLECTDAVQRDCAWIEAVGANPRPSVRFAARAVHTGEEVLLYGGDVGGTPSDEIFTLDPCATLPTSWASITPTGTAPPPRAAHTLTRLTPAGTVDPPIDIIVIGGADDPLGNDALADVWRLQRRGPGSFHWDEVVIAADSEAFVARAQHVAVLVPGEPLRIWVYGGTAEVPSGISHRFGDLWELRLVDLP